MPTIHIHSGSGRKLKDFDISDNTTVAQLKALFSKHSGHSVERQRLYIQDGDNRTTLSDDKKLSQYELGTGKRDDIVYFRDLGPQVAWKTVFLVEYAGPLLLYVLFYLRPPFIYPESTRPHTFVQNLALACWVGHYLKRELETLFVHRFSHGTMPLFNIFKNSGYYWGFGALCGYFVNHPLYTDPPLMQVYVACAFFVLFELGNLICHIMLRNLRPENSTVRKIPRGFLFEYVSCPNYTFEILAWIAFTIMTQTVAAGLFALVGAGQMIVWAIQKHKRYHKEFTSYPKNRKIIFPFIF
jgi:very-long-chain enoyl-CoA reductase